VSPFPRPQGLVPDWDEELELPEADELIKKIFWPYPVGGIRLHQRRRARAFARRQGR
jgi:hypothetical protein